MARVVVNDLAVARHALLEQVTTAGMTLNRFEIVKPSLEDIFLRLVAKEEEPA